MATQPKTYLTEEQYLAMERAAESRSEYHDGEMFAMAGTSLAHNRIVINLVAALHSALRKRDCDVFSSEMRVAIPSAGAYTYPDVMVVCGKPAFIDNQADTLTNPGVIIEVLSKSTADYDRAGKFHQYKRIPSFKEYVTISQTEILANHSIRQPDESWLVREIGSADGVISLPSIGVQLNLSSVYERVFAN